ncbi:MAG TPA: toprim domain-containing protein [Accumulibacter sp.]|nr:toprim domain-containing protein [Accumulibacter sp.]
MEQGPPMLTVYNPVPGFREAMHRAGIVPPAVVAPDGALHRFHVEGDHDGSLNGWYCLHMDGRSAGAFGSWKTGFSCTWSEAGKRISTAEREAFAELVQEVRSREKAERRALHKVAARSAQAIWTAAVPADRDHSYLIAKGVQAHTLRQSGAALLVPLLDIHGLLWNVQRIMPDGAKRFRKGRAGGLHSPIGDLTNPAALLVCEGWATGATLHEESGHPVLCAMNAGNLLPVAKAARAAWPGAELVICADNDRKTEGNPGLTAATAAAKAVGARLAAPEFPEGASGSDFNDLANLRKVAG